MTLVLATAMLPIFSGVSSAQAQPQLSLNDVMVQEGNVGTNNARFMVTLSGPSTQTVTVQYSTGNDSATAGQDYTSQTSRTLTFEPQDRTETFTVEILGDTADEPNEQFFVNLTNPVNATIADAQGIGTIQDDDTPGSSPAPTTTSTRPSTAATTTTRPPSPSPSPARSPSPSPRVSPTPSPTPAAVLSPSPAPSPTPAVSPSPVPSNMADTGTSDQAAALALAMLMLVIGGMLRRSYLDEAQ